MDPVLLMFVPLSVKAAVAVLEMSVTLPPMLPLIVAAPAPVPLLVRAPVLLTNPLKVTLGVPFMLSVSVPTLLMAPRFNPNMAQDASGSAFAVGKSNIWRGPVRPWVSTLLNPPPLIVVEPTWFGVRPSCTAAEPYVAKGMMHMK